MSRNTGIEWTDDTWNPIRGCSRVSEGCRNCYAEGVAYRFSGPGKPYEGLVRIGADGERRREWNGQIKFVEKHLLDPLKWGAVLTGIRGGEGELREKWGEDGTVTVMMDRPRRIFVNSMSDLFHENVTDAMRDKIFAVMALCPQHAFQVLTKRPERMLAYLTNAETWPRIVVEMELLHAAGKVKADALKRALVTGMPLPHVQLGVSVEDQPAADKRIPLLLQTPAAMRFLSCEPLLGALDIKRWMWPVHPWWLTKYGTLDAAKASGDPGAWGLRRQGLVWAGSSFLNWVIAGGESGPGARPMHPDWVRSLRDQCVHAGVPFFFKQWGEWAPGAQGADYSRKGAAFTRIDADGNPSNDPTRWLASDALFYRVGKKAAGNVLDGQVWHQFPEVRA